MKNLCFFIIILSFCLVLPAAVNADAKSQDDICEYENLLENNGQIILMIRSADEQIVYANQAAADYYGYSKAKLRQMTVSQINILDSAEIKSEMDKAQLKDENQFRFKHRLADGTERYVEVTSFPAIYQGEEVLFSTIYDINRKVLLERRYQWLRLGIYLFGSFVIIVLVSQQLYLHKKARQLRQVNQELSNFNLLRQTFINADPGYVYLKDQKLKYIFFNDALTELFGLPAEKIVGQADYDLLEPDFAQMCTEIDQEALSKKKQVTRITFWAGKHFRTTKFPVLLPDQSYGVGAYIADVTQEHMEQQRKERELAWHKFLLEALTRSFTDKKEQLDYTLSKILDLTGCAYGCIFYYDEASSSFTVIVWASSKDKVNAGPEQELACRLLCQQLRDEVIRSRQVLLENNYRGADEKIATQNVLFVPTIVDGHVVAVTGLANKPGGFDETDVNELTMLMGSVWNVTKRRKHLAELAFERDRFFKTLMAIGDAVMVVNMEKKITMLNEVAARLAGWSRSDAVGTDYRRVLVLAHEEEGKTIKDPVEQVLASGQIYELENHAMLLAKDGARIHIEDSAAPVLDDKGEQSGVVLVFRDVTDKKIQRKKIEYLSFHDSLTGLYNRRFFEEELNRLDSARNLPISVVMCDVNSLKLTNDIFGHASGDELIRNVAAVLKSICRKEDILARWGGDEFVLLLPQTDQAQAEQIAARINQGIRANQVHAIRNSVSLGYAVKREETENIADLINQAETLMYQTKALEREKNQEQVLQAVTDILFGRERSRQHAEGTSQIAAAFARHLQLPDESIMVLQEAARLHDIGRVVFAKNEGCAGYQLREQNQDEDIRRHPVVGYQILNSFDQTMALAEIVLAHHEAWDGSGYPRGLAGESIPYLSRIIALAGFYESYLYQGKDQKNLAKELSEHSGCRYDPVLVADFLEWLEEDGFKPAAH